MNINNIMIDRFLIEARSGKYTANGWLVVLDKETDEYIKEEGSKRKYKTFYDSDEIYEYIAAHY